METFDVVDTTNNRFDRVNVSASTAYAYVARAADLTGSTYEVRAHDINASESVLFAA